MRTVTPANVEILSSSASSAGDIRTWRGTVADSDLNAIFRQFNRVDREDAERLRELGYRLPSLSVGDIITNKDTGRSHIITGTSFVEIDDSVVETIAEASTPSLTALLHATSPFLTRAACDHGYAV